MKKSYKLIKEYPGSPSLGTMDWGDTFKNYPEFWEEIIKEYEILTFMHKDRTVVHLRSDGFYHYPHVSSNLSTFTESDGLSEEAWDIHSVKRLSDGEVFMVGDTYTNNEYPRFGIRTITNFNVTNGSIYINNTSTELGRWSKCKTPLFTTSDGVDIFKGDTVWGIYVDDHKIFCVKATPSIEVYPWVHSTFSSEEAAKEYIFNITPSISLQDIKNYYKEYTKIGNIVNHFSDLIKSRK